MIVQTSGLADPQPIQGKGWEGNNVKVGKFTRRVWGNGGWRNAVCVGWLVGNVEADKHCEPELPSISKADMATPYIFGSSVRFLDSQLGKIDLVASSCLAARHMSS